MPPGVECSGSLESPPLTPKAPPHTLAPRRTDLRQYEFLLLPDVAIISGHRLTHLFSKAQPSRKPFEGLTGLHGVTLRSQAQLHTHPPSAPICRTSHAFHTLFPLSIKCAPGVTFLWVQHSPHSWWSRELDQETSLTPLRSHRAV